MKTIRPWLYIPISSAFFGLTSVMLSIIINVDDSDMIGVSLRDHTGVTITATAEYFPQVETEA
jgi:hypothetical protein